MLSFDRRLCRQGALFGAVSALACVQAAPCGAQQLAEFNGPQTSKPKVDLSAHLNTWSYQGGPSKAEARGLGIFATSGSTAVNLAAPTEMLDGPNGSLFEQAAGIGWHSGHMSAMFGYMRPSSIKSATQFRADDYTPAYRNSARVGLGWSLHF